MLACTNIKVYIFKTLVAQVNIFRLHFTGKMDWGLHSTGKMGQCHVKMGTLGLHSSGPKTFMTLQWELEQALKNMPA